MQMLAVISIAVLILAALLVAIFRGSRPPQPIPASPTVPKQAAFAALVPIVCAVIPYATFKGVELYLNHGLAPPKPLVILLLGVIAPWFVGIYFASLLSGETFAVSVQVT
jgi:uncharacterized membrane protein YfcA